MSELDSGPVFRVRKHTYGGAVLPATRARWTIRSLASSSPYPLCWSPEPGELDSQCWDPNSTTYQSWWFTSPFWDSVSSSVKWAMLNDHSHVRGKWGTVDCALAQDLEQSAVKVGRKTVILGETPKIT